MQLNEVPEKPTHFDVFDGEITTYTAPEDTPDPVLYREGEYLVIKYRWLLMKKWAMPDEEVDQFIVSAHEFINENLA